MRIELYKGDSANNFLKLKLKNTTKRVITKLYMQCGPVYREVENPEFPVYFSMTPEETKLLDYKQRVKIAVDFSTGEHVTSDGYILVIAKQEAVYGIRR